MSAPTTSKPTPVMIAKIPATKAGTRLLESIKAVFNYPGYNLRVLYSGPRRDRYTCLKADATAFRLYVTRKYAKGEESPWVHTWAAEAETREVLQKKYQLENYLRITHDTLTSERMDSARTITKAAEAAVMNREVLLDWQRRFRNACDEGAQLRIERDNARAEAAEVPQWIRDLFRFWRGVAADLRSKT